MKTFLCIMVVLLVGLTVFSTPAIAQSASGTEEAVSVVVPSLAIKAPQVAYQGEKVEIKVVELPGGEPVSGAGVWAVDINSAPNPASVSIAQSGQVGIFLGKTGNSGELQYIFHDSSTFLLTAFKDGRQPAFSWITIQPLKAMAIKGPESAMTYQTCEFTVYEPENGNPVSRAGVWALPVNNEAVLTSNEFDLVSSITANGIFLGYTGNQGKVSHAFDKAGMYMLLATHRGYKPAFGKITILEVKELAIRAPEAVYVYQPFKLRVVEKSVLTVEIPVANAAVWAVSQANTLDTLTDEKAVADCGIFLGLTNKDGYIYPNPCLKETGQYWLVAFKTGYVPGIDQITVKPLKKMAIKGPETALIYQTCEFTVYEPENGNPVSGAGIWALMVDDETVMSNDEDQMAALISDKGIFLGLTNNAGQVFHAFDEPGGYMLVATHQGYKPAFGKITISEVKELAIRAPDTVGVLQPVSLRVVEKSALPVEIPVSGAAVWAVENDGKSNPDDYTDLKFLAEKQGIFLGWTDDTGYVSPQPRFSQAGQYWLIAVKDGYVPGIDTITVKKLLTATPSRISRLITSVESR
ncbi:MAG: hypothetical protein JXA46_09155 [Dehalococcoidales bacterium]|nr:hypothetical protein [Dehalococcoidales bacterium]